MQRQAGSIVANAPNRWARAQAWSNRNLPVLTKARYRLSSGR